MTEDLYKEMAQSIIDGDSDLAIELARKSIELNMHPLETITKGFVIGVNYIGDQFGAGEAFLPELVMAGEAMKAAVAVLE
ncbi:MAG TPA: B12-binding domain-containing protein, partial [Anaerolineales bacterium]|nr:B12-binding domain-containing protein [Anaerolineales bacterium]